MGLPVLILAAYMIGNSYGNIVVFLNIAFILCLLIPLVVFHFYKNNIKQYGLFSQLSIVTLTSIKVYFMGGMLLTGTPVYVGFLAPVFALIFPNKKRAILLFFLYIIGMVLATMLNPYTAEDHLFAGQLLGFFIGTTFIFLTLYYFTTQLEKSKKTEIVKVKELDELKTKFFTHIAHEFRTPLSIIIGNAERMKNEPEKYLNESCEIISRNANDLVGLSNKLLTLSKLEANAIPLKPIQDDITIYLNYLVESFESLAKIKDIELAINCADDEIIMDFDPDKIHGIISNLISNAIKFTPKKGEIQVSVRTEMISNKDNLVINIVDSGVGIPTNQVSNIFNRYYQAENHLQALKQGAGLGLALTKEYVNLHGGEIFVESKVGKGSRFTIQIPISNKSKKTHFDFQPTKKKDIEITRTKKEVGIIKTNETKKELLNLLIVEDNEDVISYLKSLLAMENNLFIANDGIEGFEKALQIIPDLIISDVMMPNLDGFSLCKKIKNDIRTSHIPIILLTALADQNSKLDGLNMGADAYLTKPFNTKELFVRINKLISLRKSLQQHYTGIITDKTLIFSNKTTINKEDAFISKVRRILEENLTDEDFGINQLCNTLAMSRSQLYRKFSSLTDLTVHQFIMTLKLQRAKELLLSTDLNVSEVAFDTGFKNTSHFSRVFKKEFGNNPSCIKIEKQS